MHLSLVDVVFYALMVGLGELFFIAAAVRLGASAVELGLVATLPLCFGTMGPMLGLIALRAMIRRKRIVLAGVGGQILVLSTLAWAAYSGHLSVVALICLVCLYQISGQAAATTWNSWYGDVVPAEIRGIFFARRNRLAHLTTCVALVSSGFLLDFLDTPTGAEVATKQLSVGFTMLFSIAALARTISFLMLLASPEPASSRIEGWQATRDFARSPAAQPIRRLLLIAACVQFLVYISSPYFNPFQLQILHFTWIEYMLSSVAVLVFKFLWLPAWGRAIDRYGARSVYCLALLLLSLIPLPWIWADGIAWVLVAQALSGFAWGGHEVANFSLVLEAAKSEVRAPVFAAMNFVNGVSQLFGSLLGAAMLQVSGDNYRAIFVASIAGRLGVAMLAPSTIPLIGGRPNSERRKILFHVLGVRPSGGLESRPIFVQNDPPLNACEAESEPPIPSTGDRASIQSNAKPG
jgi:MFS family permease